LELKNIKALIDLMKKNDLSVFEMEKDGFKIKLQKGAGDSTGYAIAKGPFSAAPVALAPLAVSPATTPSATAPAPAPAAAPQETGAPLREVVSPMVGTFYRASSPEAPAFVELGKEVTEDTVVCIIEAMKVMNEIKAETRGTIAEIVAENGKPVQFGQVLFRVR
jgi:acetyl-CoA carboxylase biotin carboxyl carrier protein